MPRQTLLAPPPIEESCSLAEFTPPTKQAVDHSEQCRSRMEAILVTTTEGHERLERARDRFAQAAKEREDEEPQRKRHRPEGEGVQPLAPPREGGSSSSSSGSALPPSPAPPPLEPPPLAKRSLEQETEMTDATVEQQRESTSKRKGSTGNLVASAEGREGGPVTLDLTKMELGFQQNRLPNQMQKIDRKFVTVVADGTTDRF